MDNDNRVATRPPEPVSVTLNEDHTLGVLVRQLAQDSTTLIKQEISLAKAEVRQSVAQTAKGATTLGIAVALLAVAGLVLTAFLVLLLGELLDNHWVAALIVGVVLAILGALLALSGMRRLKEVQLAPTATIETLKGDKAWAQSEIRQVKEDLKS